jgi:Kef-type K+ transport system membrane component KefB
MLRFRWWGRMTGISFGNLLAVAAIAVAAPLVVGLWPRLRVPAVVLEILAGIAVGPSALGWVEPDERVTVLALVGLAFLLFLAGLEIDVAGLRGRRGRTAALGWTGSLAIGLAVGFVFHAGGFVRNPLLLAVALSATSLGLVVPALKDAGGTDTELGQTVIAGATVADFGAILLLSLLFSGMEGGTASRVVLFGGFAAVAALLAVAIGRLGRLCRLDAVVVALQDTTAEIRVRFAVLLLVAFVALAERVGIETILGAFVAGAVLGLVDRDTMTHPHFRTKLDAVGYGFVIPVFFVTSGLRFDLDALTSSGSTALRVPLFLAALLAVRGIPAFVTNRDTLGVAGARAVALLHATSLPFLVTAAAIGVEVGAISQANAAALVAAGLVSVVVFPPLALGQLSMPANPGMPRHTSSVR